MYQFRPLTYIEVRHGKIPTSIFQGPFLASVAKLVCCRCSNAVDSDLGRDLYIK